MKTFLQLLVTGLLSVGLTACQQEAAPDTLARQVFLDKRALALEAFGPCPRNASTAQASIVAASLCRHFTVPENYEDPESRQIALKVMVIPALSDLPEPDPLFLLAGGPGQAATDLVQVAQVFSRSRTDRDIVLVDQRGTGELSPFDCQMSDEESRALEKEDPGFEQVLAIQIGLLSECLSEMDASPHYYTTDIAMRDLDAVREALGYSSLNLWGASYGSRAALAYLQAYPQNTRTLIIDAIAPVALTLPVYNERDASASLDNILIDCAADDHCSTAFPNLEDHYRALLDRLQTPQAVSMLDERDFSPVETTIADFEFLAFIRQVLYSREAQRLIPLIIEQAWQGNYRPVFALASQYNEGQINQGMFLSVICSEDYSLITDDLLATQGDDDYLIRSALFNEFIFQACEIWPKRELPAAYFEPVRQDKPVLIFSGALDPVTPPVWGELVHASLPDSRHLVLEGFGHGTLLTQCTSSIMNSFIENASLAELETGCIENFRRRPFFVTPGGSAPVND